MSIYEKIKRKPERTEPLIWIRRLVIYKSIRPDETEVIRDITFDKGLNIIWAEEVIPEDHTVAVAGHSAGKTTLCRMIRYALGEHTFANKINRKLIRGAFPAAYVAAEILIDGTLWAIARPFDPSHFSSYAEKGLTVEELLNKESKEHCYQEKFIEAINQAVLDIIPTSEVVRSREKIQWGHILAWCTRDQETRYQNLWEWRSPRSESEWPNLERHKEDGLFIMRNVLGLFLDQELKLEKELAKNEQQREELEKKIENAKKKPSYWLEHYLTELKKLLDIDQKSSIPLKSEDLFSENLTSSVNKNATETDERVATLQEEISKVKEELADIDALIADEERKLQRYAAAYNIKLRTISELDPKIISRIERRQKLRELDQDLNCDYADIPLKDCTYIQENDEKLKYGEHLDQKKLAESQQQREEVAQEHKTVINTIQQNIQNYSQNRRQKYLLLESKIKEVEKQNWLKDKLKDYLDMASKYEAIVTDDKFSYAELDDLRKELANVIKDIERIKNELEELLKKHDENRNLLTSIFNATVKEVLSNAYNGDVLLSNRELYFRITRGATMSGEAVETLSVLLADISSMLYSTLGKGNLPGFVIHDSPREADLGMIIYQSFIRFIDKQQSYFKARKDCPFQYIISTTSEPPAEYQTDKYVNLRINALMEEGLLLKANIANEENELWQNDEGG